MINDDKLRFKIPWIRKRYPSSINFNAVLIHCPDPVIRFPWITLS